MVKEYHPKQPIISFHIPKTAGTSFRTVLKTWFGDQLLHHALDENTGKMPTHFSPGEGSIVHGHFAKGRLTGWEDYYPNQMQWITVLRDPCNLAASLYFYLKKIDLPNMTSTDMSCDEFLTDFASRPGAVYFEYLPHFLKLLPVKKAFDRFLFVGVTEQLQSSVDLLADILGKEKIEVPVLNVSRKYEVSKEIRDLFEEKFAQEYELYRMASENLKQRTG